MTPERSQPPHRTTVREARQESPTVAPAAPTLFDVVQQIGHVHDEPPNIPVPLP